MARPTRGRCRVSATNEAIVRWLDAAADATEGQPTERAIVLWLAERAAELGAPGAPGIYLEPQDMGASRADFSAAIHNLRRGHQLIRRGWVLTIPSKTITGAGERAA